MSPHEVVEIKRDVDAIEVPSGHKITLFKGTEVTITQSLGGNYTVMTHQGAMASIMSKDGDALGKEVVVVPKVKADGTPKTTKEMVWDQLKTCYDPEIPHNIVDLGLIYKCEIQPLDSGKNRVDVTMTLTAPGCGMGDMIRMDAQNKVSSIEEVEECRVEVTFDPPWDRSMMSPALRREYM